MIATTDAIPADVVEALPGVHRVVRADRVVGFVVEAGDRFVALYGPVYNTSVEIAQSRDLDTAVHRLLAH
ncbi:hypothetical protein [Pseudolysinimonas sp.]|uniref:hypothetical protein n=1 Tax=Pseudolysinimonas sp. TaxID=2680009 RepID=UPI003F7D5194